MLKTEWGTDLDPKNVLQEYPRPQMVRKECRVLNGLWDYAITNSDRCPESWDGKILVPFSPEAQLSGVMRDVAPEDRLWYQLALDEKPRSGYRLLLHFGAVDQMAEVFLNGVSVGSHIGGFTPFTLDLTDQLSEAENLLTVCVRDRSDTCELSRGKQKTKRGGIWYTRQSGIWQTVWCEWVPETYIEKLIITPDVDHSLVEITVCSAKNELCYVTFGSNTYGSRTNTPIRITVSDPILWSPETPHLYPLAVSLGEDLVESYFAMRKVEMKQDEAGIPRLFLNGKPYFHSGVLDQGYWPDGLLTAPSDEALIRDITVMKELGFNMLRKHIKLEPMRFYYHCDRLGMLVWQDMPSGGGNYRFMTISAPLVTGIHRKDTNYKVFAREDEAARAHFRIELQEMVETLYNCPCIVLWVPFNEGWGQFDAAEITELLRRLDPTRLIDHASGWHDQAVSDVKSLHVYFRPYRFRKDKNRRAVVLSEFGGYTLALPDHCWNDAAFGYRNHKSKEHLAAAITKLYEEQIIPAVSKGLCATVYTQVSDVEDECNGFMTYDRRVVKIPAEVMQTLNEKLKL